MYSRCPVTKPSKRRPPRRAVVARSVAETFGLKPSAVRDALAAALAAERRTLPGGRELAERAEQGVTDVPYSLHFEPHKAAS